MSKVTLNGVIAQASKLVATAFYLTKHVATFADLCEIKRERTKHEKVPNNKRFLRLVASTAHPLSTHAPNMWRVPEETVA